MISYIRELLDELEKFVKPKLTCEQLWGIMANFQGIMTIAPSEDTLEGL